MKDLELLKLEVRLLKSFGELLAAANLPFSFELRNQLKGLWQKIKEILWNFIHVTPTNRCHSESLYIESLIERNLTIPHCALKQPQTYYKVRKGQQKPRQPVHVEILNLE